MGWFRKSRQKCRMQWICLAYLPFSVLSLDSWFVFAFIFVVNKKIQKKVFESENILVTELLCQIGCLRLVYLSIKIVIHRNKIKYYNVINFLIVFKNQLTYFSGQFSSEQSRASMSSLQIYWNGWDGMLRRNVSSMWSSAFMSEKRGRKIQRKFRNSTKWGMNIHRIFWIFWCLIKYEYY